MNAVDTNVLAYSVDSSEPLKGQKARDLIAKLAILPEAPVLLWQVAVEFVACMKRWEDRGNLSRQDLFKNLTSIEPIFMLILPRTNLLFSALNLLQRHSLSYWDALLLAACIEAGVDTLYSEDFSHGGKYDLVTTLNPFV